MIHNIALIHFGGTGADLDINIAASVLIFRMGNGAVLTEFIGKFCAELPLILRLRRLIGA